MEAIGSLPAEKLGLRAASHLRSVRELARHIVGARIGWFHGTMGEGGPNIADIARRGRDGIPSETGSELAHGLRSSWQMIEQALGRWQIRDLDQTFERKRDGQTNALTRQWIVWHVLEHDIHHGGELFYSLGMHGLPTPDL